jgi:hypothetical protein
VTVETFLEEFAVAHPLLALVAVLMGLVVGTTWGAYRASHHAIGKALGPKGPVGPVVRDLVRHLRGNSQRLSALEKAHNECCGARCQVSEGPYEEVVTSPGYKIPIPDKA